jgi:hypothetical protein
MHAETTTSPKWWADIQWKILLFGLGLLLIGTAYYLMSSPTGVPDIPIYPNAERLARQEANGQTTITFETADKPDDVGEFYERALLANRWTRLACCKGMYSLGSGGSDELRYWLTIRIIPSEDGSSRDILELRYGRVNCDCWP